MKITIFGFALCLVTVSSAFAAEPSATCAAKRADIEAQIVAATSRGNSQEIAGLKKALAANKANCTDAALTKEHEADIQKAKKKVAEREQDLIEAERKGDAKKIAKQKSKLEDARNDLAEAEKLLGP
jgi:small-conductance mechanosensitive channel